MRMRFGGAPEIRATRAAVWKALLDPHFVASVSTAIERVDAKDPTHFSVVAGLGVGMLKVRFTIDAELFDIVELQSAKLKARGKAPGSTLQVTTGFTLTELEPSLVRLAWTAESEVGGTVASVGARLLEGTARRLAEEFWQDFADKVSATAAT
ncbi:MAG: carbon monoxide dehydrogenase subunit G [Gemmatimonadetes bacterium]|nr:carbon monoxide dehydrogenase subunit G [Gemmatimonadota bacterium]